MSDKEVFNGICNWLLHSKIFKTVRSATSVNIYNVLSPGRGCGALEGNKAGPSLGGVPQDEGGCYRA